MNKITIDQLRQMNADRVALVARLNNAKTPFERADAAAALRGHDAQAAQVAGGVDDIVAEVERRIKAGVK